MNSDVNKLNEIFDSYYGNKLVYLNKNYNTINELYQVNLLQQHYPQPIIKVQQNNIKGNLFRTTEEFNYVKVDSIEVECKVKSLLFLELTMNFNSDNLQRDWIVVLNYLKNCDLDLILTNHFCSDDDLEIYLNEIYSLIILNTNTPKRLLNTITNVETFIDNKIESENIIIFCQDEDVLLLKTYCKNNNFTIENNTFMVGLTRVCIVNDKIPFNKFKTLVKYPKNSGEKNKIKDLLVNGIDILDWNNVWLFKDTNSDYYL